MFKYVLPITVGLMVSTPSYAAEIITKMQVVVDYLGMANSLGNQCVLLLEENQDPNVEPCQKYMKVLVLLDEARQEEAKAVDAFDTNTKDVELRNQLTTLYTERQTLAGDLERVAVKVSNYLKLISAMETK